MINNVTDCFEIKKFVAFIAFNKVYRELFFDKAEEQGINSCWDTYHVLEGREKIPVYEVKIMEEIYYSHIKSNSKIRRIYSSSIENFQMNLTRKINSSI